MATPAHAQAVKSLNKGRGRRRFVFKTFSQRINDIDINVFRSLDKVKAEPSEGSSFFRDCLIEWRELNTAEDFISFYEEMLPFVQTLPLVLLHKELIFSKLESRLQMKARLSLEPILRLMSALSRDLLEDFLPFLSRLVNSLVYLLKDGGEKEPEIVEQIFTLWSYIMMYLQKYLMLDIEGVLMGTLELRYYPRDYIQEFMAESMSFLLRNAWGEQLEKGIKRVLSEVANPVRKSAVAAFLYYVMRGTSTSLHSRAERVLTFLLEDSTFSFCDKFAQGSGILVEVVISTLERLCEDLEPRESSLVWKCLYRELNKSSTAKRLFHLRQLLRVLTSVVKIKKGRLVSDYQPMIRLVEHLVSTLMASFGSREGEDGLSDYLDEVLQLMLCIIDGLLSFSEVAKIDFCSQQWVPIFTLKNLSLLTFVRELLQRDHLIVKAFRTNILSAMNNMIESSEEAFYLLLSFCERQQTSEDNVNILNETSDSRCGRIQKFLEEKLKKAVQDIDHGNIIDEAKLATLWGVINCYPYFKGNSDLLIALFNVLKEHMAPSAENIAGIPRMRWQCIFGAVLSSYYKLQFARRTSLSSVTEMLSFARNHNPCVQVLSAVADYLDYMHGPVLADDNVSKTYHSELQVAKALEALNLFSKNLRLSNKDIRLATLRILCHYEPLRSNPSYDEHPPKKKMKTEETQAYSPNSNVPELLLSIEETPLTVSTSRKMVNLISRIQMDLSAGRIHEAYMSLVFNGMVAVFRNRFSYLWNPASECLAVLISKHSGLVWDEFVCYFDECQAKFGTPHDQNASDSPSLPDKRNALVGRFYSFLFPPSDSTPSTTVVSLLLKSLQKVPFVAESRSRQIIPLFLEFLGYSRGDPVSVGLFNRGACKGKEWKGALKEWLTLLKLMRNPRSFYLSQFLKDVLQNRLLDDNDAEVQLKALECLLLWRDDFLLPYDQHLKNLISSKDLREELTTWSLSKESNLVEGGHRAHLVTLVIRILMPKVRNLKALASRKHTSVYHRKAVLSFIAQLDVHELPLFFALLIKPLNIMSEENEDLFWNSPDNSLGDFKMANFLKYFSVEAISTLSWKKKYGFLHVIQHILEVFDESHVHPFLDFLMGCVVRLLANCGANLCAAKGSESVPLKNASDVRSIPDLKDGATLDNDLTGATLKQFKEMRSLCLKIVALVLDKYDDFDLGSGFWDLFFLAVKPLVESFKQEGSSSKKPSSLFLCFLSMSRSHNLVTLLCREKTLIPGIFSILTVTTASEAVKSSVLMFIENLLNLDIEDEKDNTVKGVLVPNIEALICSLHCLFLGDNFKRKLVGCHGEREIKILKLLSKYMLDPLHARKYLDILLSFLAVGVKDSDSCREAFLAVQDTIPMLGNESSSKILNAVSPLLVDAELDLRLCICDLLKALAKIDSSLDLVAKHVCDLNAISAMETDGIDYDKIANTYAKIDADFFKKASEQHTLIILSQGVYNMSSEELTLRHGAYSLFRTFIEFSALVLCQEVSDLPEFCKEFATADGSWTGARILFIIRKFLLKHIGDAINGGSSVRKEWIDLLREMVIKIPDTGNLAAFKALCSEDAEVDFFNNIVHLQKHRRARALMRFANVISRNNLPEGVVRNVFVPLFFNMLLDGQDGKDDNLRTACVEALASVSAHMGWKSYYALLARCFREIRRHSNKKKILLRLICSILDKFHFLKGGDNQEAEGCPADALNGDTCTVIRTKLYKTVFLKIQKLMNSDSENVNVNVNLAALKVLKLLPVELMDSQLPTIVHRISNLLKNRLESIRDEARLALAACLKELGLEYLQFVVRILCSILKRGFELHVLGYTVNFLLSKCLSNPSLGQLDYCLDDLLRVVETDILGDVAEQKEVEKIASKMKETGKCKSFESLKLVAQNVTFRSHAWKLLSPVTAHLQKHLTPKVKVKLENMLDHIAAGIEGNPSVDQKDLFIYIYGLVEDGINKENCMGDQSRKEKKDDLQQKTGSTGFVAGVKSCSHLITVFALGLLHSLLKKNKLNENNEELLSMLDPFVKLLGDCLSSKYEDIVSSSLRCFTLLIRLLLPSLVSQADKIKATLLSIAQSTVNSRSSLVQSCLKLLTVLLRTKKITLSSEQLQMLIQFPMFVDLETDPSFIALALLKAIVKRKLVVPEIYDIVVRVAELMVKSQLESIRKKCSQILLQFLVDYDLSDKRRQQHIDFLLANLRYGHPSGREAVLEMLHAITKKFVEKPILKNFLDGQSQMLFVHLVVCLANDDDNKVRSMTAAAIKLLIGSVSPDRVHSILKYCLSWYFSEKQQLLAAAAQVLGLFIEVMGRSFRKHINSVLPGTKTILHSAVSADTQRLQDTVDEASIPFWKEAYYSLVMIEKMLHQFPDLSFAKDIEDIWEMVFELLLHPHAWLRTISCRLLNYYFGALAEMKRANSQKSVVNSLLTRPSRLFVVAASLCSQLEAQPATGDVANVDLLTANLVFAIYGLCTLIGQMNHINCRNFWSNLEQHEQLLYLKAFDLLDSKKGKSTFLALTSDEHVQEGEDDPEDSLRNILIISLLKKMGKLALENESIQMRIVFNVYKSFTFKISQEDCRPYAFQILLPLYKVCEGFTGKVISDDLKQLAREVSESVRDSLGTQIFVQIYSNIRSSLKAKRDKRRQAEKLMVVVNPVRNAKRKLRLAAKNHANKKRKIMTMKRARWARS